MPQVEVKGLTEGSFAGHSAANTLATSLPDVYRVILIDANAFATHLPAVVRALVVPESEKTNLTAELNTATVFPKGSRHVVVNARVVKLGEGRVTLDREWEGSQEVEFEVSVVSERQCFSTKVQIPVPTW